LRGSAFRAVKLFSAARLLKADTGMKRTVKRRMLLHMGFSAPRARWSMNVGVLIFGEATPEATIRSRQGAGILPW